MPEGKQNAYIVTKFDLPPLDAGAKVILTPKDIRDQFTAASDVQLTQGGTLADGRIYYTFGNPKRGYPLELMVFDLEEKRIIARINHLNEAFRGEEIECCGFYNGMLLCNTNEGGIFKMNGRLLSD